MNEEIDKMADWNQNLIKYSEDFFTFVRDSEIHQNDWVSLLKRLIAELDTIKELALEVTKWI